jgi:hypothetical protein
MDKKLYLKESLSVLNKIKTSVDRITIMKPKIDENHIPYENYYNFDNIDISNIKDKIQIVECENIGISYGQFLTGIFNDLSFDFYIFTEDDYLLFNDDFDIYLKNKVALNSYLCVFYYKDKKWSLNDYLNNCKDEFINLNSYNTEIINKMNDYFFVPDHSCGIISNKTFKKIFDKFSSLDNLIKLFNFNIRDRIWVHQIIFGYLLYLCDITIEDLSSDNLPLFYTTGGCVKICYKDNIISVENLNEISYYLDNPIFVPREFFYPYYQDYNITNLKKYIKKFEEFEKQYNKINLQLYRLHI